MWDLNNACDECWNCEWFRMNDYNDEGCCGDTEPCHEYLEMENRRNEMPNEIANNMADTINQLDKELKDLREENKVLMQECDRLIKERGKLLSKVSGGDVLRICQLEEQLEKAKRLLKAAVEQMAEVGDVCDCIHSQYCPLDECGKFTFHDEIMKFINN